MAFRSILFKRTEDGIKKEILDAPAFFVDLNLDQVMDAITSGAEEYNLRPFLYTSLHDIEAIKYRQEVAQDLEHGEILEIIKSFALKMRTMRQYLGMLDKLFNKYNKEGWFLEAVSIYCETVQCLLHDLGSIELTSQGFMDFREFLTTYAGSESFTSLMTETTKLKSDLSTVKYCIRIKGNRVDVRKYESENDYSAEVEKTFEKFKKGTARDYRAKFSIRSSMSHVEADILNLIGRLYPDIFMNLDNYCAKNGIFVDETIEVFDREIQFYVAYLDHIAKFKRAGLKFCYPQISNKDRKIYNHEGFDLALANKLIPGKLSVVCNDFYLKEKERIFVVSGPNQGGKTTFARMFGQLHYLAGLGLPVPGRDARLFLCDRLFTHFEKEEDIKSLRGKLDDDLIRVHDILSQATSDSVIIMNEIFTSTTLKDAVFLGKKIMAQIIQLDLLCVFVTFLDELASFREKTVSLVSAVAPENPAVRTYKIVRKRADGLAYALSIAEKHQLTPDYIKKRIGS
ncbi:endonuclease MutS2 [bacterium BMS3Abin14]|nr:endonuclease MutS2 [bacterium BMS3Abin14]